MTARTHTDTVQLLLIGTRRSVWHQHLPPYGCSAARPTRALAEIDGWVCCVARTIRTLPVRMRMRARRPSRFLRDRYRCLLRWARSTPPEPPAVALGLLQQLESLGRCVCQRERLSVFRDLDSRPCAFDRDPCAVRGMRPPVYRHLPAAKLGPRGCCEHGLDCSVLCGGVFPSRSHPLLYL